MSLKFTQIFKVKVLADFKKFTVYQKLRKSYLKKCLAQKRSEKNAFCLILPGFMAGQDPS